MIPHSRSSILDGPYAAVPNVFFSPSVNLMGLTESHTRCVYIFEGPVPRKLGHTVRRFLSRWVFTVGEEFLVQADVSVG